MRVRIVAGVLFFFVVSALLAAADAPQSTLHLAEEAPLHIAPTSDTATGVLYLVNDGKDNAPLELSLGDFTVDATHQVLPAVTTLERTPGVTSIAAGKRTLIKITVTGAWPGAGASAPLRNEGTTIGTIHLVGFPFGVSPEAYKDGTPYPLHVVEGGGGGITLVNSDALPYHVRWSLILPDGDSTSDTVKIPPLSSAWVRIQPKANWFSWSSLLDTVVRERESDASLQLAVLPTAGNPIPTWPVRPFRIRLSRGYWSDTVRPAIATILVFLLLAAGGACSLILTNWVPNRTLKLELQDRLDNLAGAVRNLSNRIDSKIRVGLRVERLCIFDSLNARFIFSADYPATAKAAEADIQRLEKVIALVQQIDNTYQDAFTTVRGFAPTLMRDAQRASREAELLLNGRVVTDADLAEAENYIAQAKDALNGVRTLTDDFRKDLAIRVASLDARLKGDLAQSPFVARALARLRGVSDWLDPRFADPAQITAANYCAIDAANVKGQLIADVAKTIDALDMTVWGDIVDRLLNDLRGDGLSMLRRAEMRARELTEEIKVDDLVSAIEAAAYSIIVEPTEPKAGETARLWIAFNDRRLNGAAVKDELNVSWSFGDGWQESGWGVAHYFANSGSKLGRFFARRGWQSGWRFATGIYEVRATFANEKGTIAANKNLPTRRLRTVPRERSSGHTEVELVRLGVALLAAILGLLGGASEQIAKLDLIPGLIAVFLIGFSADQIKNIITAKTSAT